MKVVILAGGLGTRLAEETEVKPKPMVEIGGRPILWHILKTYAYYGFPESLSQALIESFSQGPRASEMVSRGRAFARVQLDWSSIISEYDALYLQVIL